MRITGSILARQAISGIQSQMRALEDAQRRVSTGQQVHRPSDDPVAAAGILQSTSGLRAIEQYRSNIKSGPFTDLYACGATLYELVTGQPPPPVLDRFDLTKNLPDPLAPPDRVQPGISSGFSQAVMRALELQPGKRPQSIDAFLALLPDYEKARTPKPLPPKLSGWMTATPTGATDSCQTKSELTNILPSLPFQP